MSRMFAEGARTLKAVSELATTFTLLRTGSTRRHVRRYRRRRQVGAAHHRRGRERQGLAPRPRLRRAGGTSSPQRRPELDPAAHQPGGERRQCCVRAPVERGGKSARALLAALDALGRAPRSRAGRWASSRASLRSRVTAPVARDLQLLARISGRSPKSSRGAKGSSGDAAGQRSRRYGRPGPTSARPWQICAR